MFERKALKEMEQWLATKSHRALLVTGARQVGKTFLIREFAKQHWDNVAEINLYENSTACEAISSATNSRELFLRLSTFSPVPLEPGKTVIFLDEIQEAKEAVTAIKFLLERNDFDYILSGSLLGVELKNIQSAPVGFLNTLVMYPMDFEEFCWANGLGAEVLDEVREAYAAVRPVDSYVHTRMIELMHRYLISGGMPDAVAACVQSENVQAIRTAQEAIVSQYRLDIAKYAGSRALVVKRIFDLMPSSVCQQNKKFTVNSIEGNSHFSRYENDFLWLVEANVALPVYNVTEPRYPLAMSQNSSYFKLFMSDVGLLTYQCGMDVVRDVVSGRSDINFGALYENFVAQELASHGHDLYYFKNREIGELDFLIQRAAHVVPLEVKSGKDYRRHSALSNVLTTPNYGIEEAIVLYDGNVEQRPGITYLPVYMAGVL